MGLISDVFYKVAFLASKINLDFYLFLFRGANKD